MHGITSENIHYWTNTQGEVLISNETHKTLESFDTVDAAINKLFLSGFTASARELNTKQRGR